MVTALGFMTVTTAPISALFVESARRRRDDASLEHIADRLDEIERRLRTLSVHHGLEADHQSADGHDGERL